MQRILINETRKVAGAVLGAAAIALVVSLPALAQYPNKPIHLITPYPPGGTTDILSRLVGQKMALGQPVLVEPKPGAGGNIGADFVAKSPADGYTLLMGASGPLAINASLFKNLPYDPAKDFSPIVHVASVPLVLVVHPSFPAQNIKEFLALVKTRKDLSYASAGNGTPQHLSGELFRSLTGAQLVHVPYKGSGPAITDLLGNQVPMAFESMAAVLQYVKAGKLRALAVTSNKRSSWFSPKKRSTNVSSLSTAPSKPRWRGLRKTGSSRRSFSRSRCIP